MLNHKEIINLRNAYSKLDLDGTGMITKTQLKEALEQEKLSISDNDINEIFAQIDLNGDEKINYSEFIAATISVK